ncbi:uncharacterized protein LOC134457548 [Engraulis encrasicolus]|uniref:uncharacterized protein LOC134457548 n=1 Tax=Engraulis encrasicolus TaxID=184585 RepID=UPI002FD7208C
MDSCPRTFYQSGPWIGAEHDTHSERVLPNSAKEMDMASHWRLQTEHPYKYVRSTRISSSRYWMECQKGQAVPQEQQLHDGTNLPTSAPQTLRFVDNLIHPQSTSVRGSQLASTRPVVTPVRKEMSFVGTHTAAWLKELGPLKFVGSLNLPAEVVCGQQNNLTLKSTELPGIRTLKPTELPGITTIKPAQMTFSRAPIQPQASASHYSKEDLLKMIELHGQMLVKYTELKCKAENIEKIMTQSQSNGPAEIQKKKRDIQDKIWEEDMKTLDDLTGGLVLPDDAVEKLEAIPGIMDLAREMGFPECLLVK